MPSETSMAAQNLLHIHLWGASGQIGKIYQKFFFYKYNLIAN